MFFFSFLLDDICYTVLINFNEIEFGIKSRLKRVQFSVKMFFLFCFGRDGAFAYL